MEKSRSKTRAQGHWATFNAIIHQSFPKIYEGTRRINYIFTPRSGLKSITVVATTQRRASTVACGCSVDTTRRCLVKAFHALQRFPLLCRRGRPCRIPTLSERYLKCPCFRDVPSLLLLLLHISYGMLQ